MIGMSIMAVSFIIELIIRNKLAERVAITSLYSTFLKLITNDLSRGYKL